jgi:hypothetical protein
MARPAPQPVDEHVEFPEDLYVSTEEARRMFDEAARRIAGMSGEEFVRRYDAGEYANTPDDEEHRDIIELAMLVNIGR